MRVSTKKLLAFFLSFNLSLICVDQRYNEQICDKHYKILKVSADATLDEIEQAYFIQTALCHKKLQDYRPYNIKRDNQGHRIEIYGSFGYIEYGNHYRYDFIPSDWTRDQFSRLKKQLYDIRQAYEILTDQILDKVELPSKLLDTYGLSQVVLYHEIEKRGIQDLQEYIQQQRYLSKVEPLIGDDEKDYFVFGELCQDVSLLSKEDKIKAARYLSADKKEEIEQWIADYERNEGYKVLMFVTVFFGTIVGGYKIYNYFSYPAKK